MSRCRSSAITMARSGICSTGIARWQRRPQKLVEEAPAPDLPEALRAAMARDAVRLAAAIGYEGAGTVEFLVRDGAHFFIEMTPAAGRAPGDGNDHRDRQSSIGSLRIASGEALAFPQGRRCPATGAAIEVRLLAEESAADGRPRVYRDDQRISRTFRHGGSGRSRPVPGILIWCRPITIRCWRRSWRTATAAPEALTRLEGALAEAVVTGLTTNSGAAARDSRTCAIPRRAQSIRVSLAPLSARCLRGCRSRIVSAPSPRSPPIARRRCGCRHAPHHPGTASAHWRVSEPAGRSGESLWRVADETVRVAGRLGTLQYRGGTALQARRDPSVLCCPSRCDSKSEGRLFRGDLAQCSGRYPR